MKLDREMLYNNTRQVLAAINDGEFPQVYEYLDGITDAQGNIEATPFEIATTLLECDKPKKLPAFLIDYLTELFEFEIDEGNADAMNDLGCQYYDGGRGFEQSFEKAVRLYKMAADHGNRQAMENLGYCYYYGRDMVPDYEKAFQCFAFGAFNGQLISLYKIGDMYRYGYYVEQNLQQALMIYHRCLAMMTNDDSKYVSGPVHLRLGDMYLNGLGTEKDCEAALFHYNVAEVMLYQMVKNEYMYKKSLRQAIEGQAKAREELAKNIPEDEWIDEQV